MISKSFSREKSLLAETIRELSESTRMDLCVYLSHRLIERAPLRRAHALLKDWNAQAPAEESRFRFLLYLNLRARKFALASDLPTASYFGEKDWKKLRRYLENELSTTHWERAVSRALALLTQILLFRISQEEQLRSESIGRASPS